MKLRSLAAVAALSVSLSSLISGAALAQDRVAATLAAPVAAKVRIVAGGGVFACEGATCVAVSAPSRAASTAACKALAKEVGVVTTFASENKSLTAEDLARCNAGAKGV